MKQSETDWFRPLWRRVTVTAFIVGWTILEWTLWHDELFRWLTLGALAYAVWSFFIAFDKGPRTPDAGEPGGDDAKPQS